MIAFGPDVVTSFEAASGREWIEANGRGSYAMGTVSGANTRRYHGLLTAAASPPVHRVQLVNRLEETLVSGGRHPLSCQSYPGAVEPDGFLRAREFRLDPFPVWIYEAGGVRLKKSFFLRYGEDTAVVLYEHLSGPAAEVEVRPLLSGRGHHVLGSGDARFDGRWRASGRTLSVSPVGAPAFRVEASAGEFSAEPQWRRRQSYAVEQDRGLDHLEDVFGPGLFRLPLPPGSLAALVISTEHRDAADAAAWAERERKLRGDLLARTPLKGSLGRALTLAADQFLVSRGEGMSVIAGYPWFEDWGRDSGVSAAGLCLATGRPEDAEKIIDAWTAASRDGLTPNRFSDDDGRPEPPALDAGLWLVWAAQNHFKATRHLDAVRRWAPALRRIVDAVEKGDRRGVHMDRDGLVSLPPEAAASTWMDARVDGAPVTPRSGKPVEIQALWYNALEFLAELDLKLKEKPRGYDKLASIARGSFNEKFWNEKENYPYDRIEGKEKDPSIRPNALLAVSLPYEILDAARFRAVVDRAEKELLTAGGLRTLSPADPRYRGRHAGPLPERDRAYHQGTAWPWLMGPYLTAYGKAHGSSDQTKARQAEALRPFRDHVTEAGLGTVSEVFDGDAPHRPGGCPAQAWSVAELLRVMWEENIPL